VTTAAELAGLGPAADSSTGHQIDHQERRKREAEKSRDAPERWTQERAIFVAATFFMGSGIKTPTKGVKA
jgi:hypothetical protein